VIRQFEEARERAVEELAPIVGRRRAPPAKEDRCYRRRCGTRPQQESNLRHTV
jgi:hypothetical protein